MFIRLPAVIASLIGVILAGALNDFSAAVMVSIIVAALCVLDAALAPSPTRLNVTRTGAASTRVGQEARAELTIVNPTRRTITGHLRDAWPPSVNVSPSRHYFRLRAQSSQTFPVVYSPSRRGTAHSDAVTIRTNGPLGFAGRQWSMPTDWQLTVLPPFTARRHIPSRVRQLREMDGRALLLVRGEGTEFDSLREYVAGDDVRAIDWRSTARLGETVVRTWRPERDRHVIVVLDAGRAGALRVSDAPAFDAFIEAALLQCAIAQRAGDRVSVVALSDAVQARLLSQRSATITHHVARALADVEPSLHATDWTGLPHQIATMTNRPAFVVILTTLGGGTPASGLIDAVAQLDQSHTVLIGSAQAEPFKWPDKPEAKDAFDQAAYERSQIEAKNLMRTIERAGGFVVRAEADKLPTAVVDTYIELKARGRL
ncbi:DUF58 domain-containing protein [Trueperella bialowiezensis]|uniref:Uncharacterized conserved protein (Some members contain a von Willebrand factor type A (VWA) domain) n=1 Tax=Trueperella bialowiezensis TaxID=312285 RepID=A0A3S5EW02_9ACTO|nr:DUF58 domain-containing protein [Trueperella bialowiezensis]VEI12896.1 Uncharacterized conserved protein (some members contain a von Willebrand factor type A (vWA) domain) [Trueperella bialowiezensis]